MTDTTHLRKLAEAVTSGWYTRHTGHHGSFVRDRTGILVAKEGDRGYEDFCFIAAANPNAILELLDTIDRLTTERDAANAVATRLTMQHEVAKHQVRQLTAELGDLPEAQANMLRKIKALKAERNALTKVIRSVKQEAETALVIGDEIGLRDGAEQILKECDAAIAKERP